MDFPGCPVVKNPAANAGDTDSIPGLERSHMLQGNGARQPPLRSQHSRTQEPQLLKSMCSRDCAAQTGKPPQQAHAAQLEKAHTQQLRSSAARNKEVFENA